MEKIFTKEFIKGYFSRNKNFLILSLIILVLSIILGVLFSNFIKTYVLEILKNIAETMPKDGNVSKTFTMIFLNNIRVNFIIVLFGLILSIISVLITIFNGLILGFMYTVVSPIVFVVGIFPHGVFELSAFIISLACAFLVTKLEINIIKSVSKFKVKEEIKNSEILIKDILLSIIMIFVLLLIAAIVESTITPLLLGYVI